ncbi:BgTH12-03271 [Blumeria graminis f. sp. triticale]|uniref:BgTH12-03271 n=1 Tax=Blumeria graminis f. sp. triticale TaxID=1689686 RepID=A0A9W4D3V6_BLUGR|nr:BgTH12-03271 [Blumeria graminis f. sp. triticale]
MTPLKYLALIAFTIVHEVNGTWTINKGINCNGVEYSGQNLEQYVNTRCTSQTQGLFGLKYHNYPRHTYNDGTGLKLYFINLPTVSESGTMHYNIPSKHYLAVDEHCVFYYGAKITQPLQGKQQVESDQIERCVPLTG